MVLGDEETFEDEDLLDSPILDNLKHFNLSTFEVKTLADICVAGIAFREYAGPAFIDIVEELRELNDPNRPILIAVDQVNFWDMKTVYKYEDKPITVTQLCVPYATKFLSYKKHDSYTNKSLGKNVFCIGASSYFYPISKKELVTYIDSRSSLPLTIHVPCYSHVEFLAACKLYLNTRLIDHGITNQQLLAFRIHVSNNPRLARRDATKFFMPIYSQWATRAFINYVKGQQAEVEEEILKESNDEDFYGFSVDNRVNDMPEIPPYVPNKEVESDPEDIYYPVDVDESKYNLDEEALASLPDAHLEVDVDMTKFTAAEEEQFWKMVEEDEPIDQLIASDLPLPERDLSGKEIKRIQREEVQSKEEEE